MEDADLEMDLESEEEGSGAFVSAYVSGAVTPSVDEVVGGQGGGAGDQPWKFVTFASSKWFKLSEELLLLPGREGEQWKRDQAGFDDLRHSKAQFAERSTLVRGKIQFLPAYGRKEGEHVKLTDKLFGTNMSCGHDDKYNTSLPCDDAESQSDNFVSIFDGVGQCGVWSGRFARTLAKFSKMEADIDRLPTHLVSPKHNRSNNILEEAHEHAWRRLSNNSLESPGASTAVVLSLVSRPEASRPEERHSLHEYVKGDSRSSAPLVPAPPPLLRDCRELGPGPALLLLPRPPKRSQGGAAW